MTDSFHRESQNQEGHPQMAQITQIREIVE